VAITDIIPTPASGGFGNEIAHGPQIDYAMVMLRNDGGTLWNDIGINGFAQDKFTFQSGPFRHALYPYAAGLAATEANIAAGWEPRDDFARLTDGTSNQLMIGEKHIPLDRLGKCDPATNTTSATGYPAGWVVVNSDDCSYLANNNWGTIAAARTFVLEWNINTAGSGTAMPIANAYDQPEYMGAIRHYGFGSYHPGACQFLLGDGSVRGIAVTTPVAPVLLPLSQVDSGKSVPLP